MKHLIILVIAVLSLNQKVVAQVEETPQLPSQISIHDREIQSWPLVIKQAKKSCIQCDPDVPSSYPSYLAFQDTKTMKAIKEITGIDFQKLATREHPAESGETDKEYQKIMHAGSFGQHSLTWHLEAPKYKIQKESKYIHCSKYYIPEECYDLRTKTCQLIKSQTVKMWVHHGGRVNTYTEFTGSESKVIHEWEISNVEQCSNNKLN